MPKKGENIYLRKDGRWEGRFTKGRAGGKARLGYVFGHSYREVKEKLLAAKISWQSRPHGEPGRQKTLGDVSAMWLSEAGRFLKESTAAKYREYLDYYILPTFGTTPMESISDADAEALIHRLRYHGGRKRNGLSTQTVSEVLRILRTVREYAARIGCAVRFSVEKPKAKRRHKPPRILGEADWERLRSFLVSEATPVNAGILVAMFTGVRVGELCALRWDDVSLEERRLCVHQTLQRIRDDSGTTRTRIIVTSPKSDSANRVIPLPEALCEFLAPLRREGAYLLTGEQERPVEPKTMRRRFKIILEKCGVAQCTFHTLRHTFATRCAEAGVDPKCLSAILGHADVSVTFNRYVHPTMETKRRNLEKFLRFYAQEGE